MYLNCHISMHVPTIENGPLLHAISVAIKPMLAEIPLVIDHIYSQPLSGRGAIEIGVYNCLIIEFKRGIDNIYFSLRLSSYDSTNIACTTSYKNQGEVEYFNMQKPGSLQEICDYVVNQLSNVTPFAVGI